MPARGRRTNQRQRRQFAGRRDVVVPVGQPSDKSRSATWPPSRRCPWDSRSPSPVLRASAMSFARGSTGKSAHCILVFDAQHGQIAGGRNRARRQAHAALASPGKKTTRLSSMAVAPRWISASASLSPYQGSATWRLVASSPSPTRNPVPETRARIVARLVGKPNLVHAVNVADGISIPVQHQRRHGLLFLELCHLLGELGHLLVQFIGLRALGRDWARSSGTWPPRRPAIPLPARPAPSAASSR